MTIENDYDGVLSTQAANVLGNTLQNLDDETVAELGIDRRLDGYTVKNVTTGQVDGVVFSKAQLAGMKAAEDEKRALDD